MMAETTADEKLLRGVQGGGFLEKSLSGRRAAEIFEQMRDQENAHE